MIIQETDRHSITKELHPCGHNEIAGMEPIGDPETFLGGSTHRLRPVDGIVRRIDDKHHWTTVAVGDGSQRHNHACCVINNAQRYRGGHTQAHD
jgi:hypothetical protein